jgi:hypothetical protein
MPILQSSISFRICNENKGMVTQTVTKPNVRKTVILILGHAKKNKKEMFQVGESSYFN